MRRPKLITRNLDLDKCLANVLWGNWSNAGEEDNCNYDEDLLDR